MAETCKILGCKNDVYHRGYASKYNNYCKEHGKEREKLDKRIKEQENEECD